MRKLFEGPNYSLERLAWLLKAYRLQGAGLGNKWVTLVRPCEEAEPELATLAPLRKLTGGWRRLHL